MDSFSLTDSFSHILSNSFSDCITELSKGRDSSLSLSFVIVIYLVISLTKDSFSNCGGDLFSMDSPIIGDLGIVISALAVISPILDSLSGSFLPSLTMSQKD